MKIARHQAGPEIFFSIQGEGKSLGRPSVFVRSSLCNLSCVWCDTDYTWNWRGTSFRHRRDSEPGYQKFEKSEQIVEMSPAEVAATVRAYPCTNVVLTGGEPMLHQQDWVAVMGQLRDADPDYWFEVETNGTCVPTPEFDALIDQYNVSAKMSNSEVARDLREKPAALAFFAASPKTAWKFVVSAPKDVEEIQTLQQRFEIPSRKIFIMAEGTTGSQLRERQVWLVEQCKAFGFNFTDRLHIHLWGDKRGV